MAISRLLEDEHRNPTLFGCAVGTLSGLLFGTVVLVLAVVHPIGTVLAVALVALAFVAGNY